MNPQKQAELQQHLDAIAEILYQEANSAELTTLEGIETNVNFLHSNFQEIEKIYIQNKNSYYCPICGNISSNFLDGGVAKKRRNAKCPKCGSLERHRLFWLHFTNIVYPSFRGIKISLLHVAPEPYITSCLREHPKINYISGDLLMPEAMVKLDLTNIQLWDDKFDIIICSHILEHIPDDRKAMKEMFRILKPGGVLLIMVPTYGEKTYEDFSITDPNERQKHFGQHDHVRKYGRDITDRLIQEGFDVLV